MKREFHRLAGSRFDLLVVGGGIYGAWAACDAARRGLRVALVEQRDWAAGTSSASSKLLHGGLRYLEGLHLSLIRRSLRERARLADLAPHQVHPLRFLVPLYGQGRWGRLRLGAGLALYDLLGGSRPPARGREAMDAAEVLRRAPFLRRHGLEGGFAYGDCLMDDARFVLEVVDAAMAAGCVAVNHARATALLVEAGRVHGARVRDAEGQGEVEVRAAFTLSCAGAWTDHLPPERPRPRGAIRRTRGVHLILPPLPTRDALLLFTRRDRRVIFLIPWYGRTLLGTTDTDYDGHPGDVGPTHRDVDYLLREANRYRGADPWVASDAVGAFAGLRVLRDRPGAAPSALGREWSVDEPLPGMLRPVGGKYTSARADAAALVDRAVRRMGRRPPPCGTAGDPLPWAPEGDIEAWCARSARQGIAAGLDPETAAVAARRFGRHMGSLLELIGEDPSLASRLHPALPFSRAEVRHAVRREMARSLEDVLRRRVPVAILAAPRAETFADAAALAGADLGWDAGRRAAETAALLRSARPPALAPGPGTDR